MKLERILVVDDREENRNAARRVIPNADTAGNGAEAIEMLDRGEYDLVMTDMEMETPEAGLKVVKKALEKNAVPYVLSGGVNHGRDFVEMRPYGGNIYAANGKANEETWKEVLAKISGAEGVQLHYHQALERYKTTGHPVILDDAIITALYFARTHGERK